MTQQPTNGHPQPTPPAQPTVHLSDEVAVQIDERLARSEPPISDEDTNPSRPLRPADMLDAARIAEPPLSDEDTNPNAAINVSGSITANTSARLAREEPPIALEDTNPSPVTRLRRGGGSGGAGRGNRLGRTLLALILIGGALVMALAGGSMLIMADEDDGSDEVEEQVINQPRPQAATATPAADDDPLGEVSPGEVSRSEPLTEDSPLVQPPDAQPTLPPITATPLALPTAAVDEIAAALLNPIPAEAAAGTGASRSIARGSDPFTIRTGTTRTDVISYTVQDGDTLESIAGQFGLDDFYTLIWSNRSEDYSPLRPGNTLKIPPEDGVYHEVTDNLTIAQIAELYGVDPYTIIDSEYNDLFGTSPDTLLVSGMWVVVPGGEAERALYLPQAAGSSSASSGGGSGGGAALVGSYSLWGCTATLNGGSPPYGRPLSGYTWMRGFAPGGHTGVDLAASPGSPVLAAGAGTVVYAGWLDGGYGNVAVIAHDTAFTLYAHMLNAPSVSCGQTVSAGQQVGLVGSTGNSTGNHLHFEVRDANFNVRNPQNWIGF